MKARKPARRLVRTKSAVAKRAPRKPPLLSQLLAALDARPDVTVLTRTWPVTFVQLRYALEKTVVNPNSMSPLHRETPLFYGQAWQIDKDGKAAVVNPIPQLAGDAFEIGILCDVDLLGALGNRGQIHPEVAVRLGLQKPVEREEPLTGRPMER